MKKFFKSLATASIAMVGMLVSSCQIDDITTAFVPTEAVATIKVTVTDAVNGTDITSEAVIEASSDANLVVKVEGNLLTLKGNPSLSEQHVTVSATYKGVTGTDVVLVNKLLAGGKAEYKSTVLVGKIVPPTPDPHVVTTYACIGGETKVEMTVEGTFDPSHQAGHGHDGKVWAYNQTEFILDAKFMWEAESGNLEVAAMPTGDIREGENGTLYAFYNALNVDNYSKDKVEVLYQVSAFAMYTVTATKTLYSKTYKVVRYETIDEEEQPEVVIGTITVFSVTTQCEPIETAIPGHEGHYHAGAGHADVHGYSKNAGGGIVWGE